MAPKKKVTKRNERDFVKSFISRFTPWTNKEVEKSFKPQIDLTTKNDSSRVTANLSPDAVIKHIVGINEHDDREKSNIFNKLDNMNKNLKSSVEESMTNEQILDFFPDVDAAKGIVIDSILSPNNLKRESMTITVEKRTITDDNIIVRLTKILNKYFIEDMNLNDKLEGWLEKIIYIDGAMGLVTIPVSAENIIEDMNISTESKEKSISNNSVFGVSELFKPKDHKDFEEEYMSLESNRIEFIKNVENVTNIKKSNFSKKNLNIDFIEVIDNPDILFLSQENKKQNKKQMKDKIKNFYKDNILYINEKEVNKKTTILNLEIDKCAIIPVHTPGSNNIEYTGFFIILNDNNMPIKKSEINSNMELTHTPGVFDDIFKTYNLNNLQEYSNLSNIKPEDIYKDILLEYINQGLSIKNLGYIDKDIDSTICKYLFFNNLKKKKIKFLYLPSEFLTYFAFNYDKNNIGISILTKLKTSLEQYMTIKICNILSVLDNAISKKVITLNARDEKLFTQVNDINKLVDIIRDQYLKKNTPKFSISPDAISTSAVKSSISVKVEGVQGTFDVSTENVQSQNNLVDNELFENIRREVITGLGVPPSALNALGEHEYSRSVAGSSILFANRIEKHQMISITHTSKYVQNIARCDKKLLAKLKAVIAEEDLTSIIEDIRVHLPKPHSVYSESDLNLIRGIIDNVEFIANNIYPPELSNIDDEKIRDTVDIQKALFKRNYIIDELEKMGIVIPVELEDVTQIQDFILQIKNIGHGIMTKIKEDDTQPTDEPPPGGGGEFDDELNTNNPPSNDEQLPEDTPPEDTPVSPGDTDTGNTPPSPDDTATDEPSGGPDDNFVL